MRDKTEDVLFISINKIIGGAELYFRKLGSDFIANGGQNCRLIEINRSKRGFFSVVLKLLMSGKTIVLNNSVLGTQIFYVLLLKLLGNKVILLPHVVSDHFILGSRFAAIRNISRVIVANLADSVVAISAGNKAILSSLSRRNNIVSILNYVECENIEKISLNNSLNLAMIGRIHEKHKGQIKVLECLSGILKSEGLVIHFFGDGPDIDALDQRIKELGLSQCAVLHGWKDLVGIYSTDFFCVINNSGWEGQSLAIMEAIYHDKVVIARDIQGNRGIVDPRFMFKDCNELLSRIKGLLLTDRNQLENALQHQKEALFEKCSRAIAMRTLSEIVMSTRNLFSHRRRRSR